MASSLSNLINNLSEGIDIIKCKLRYDDKNVKRVQLNISDCFLEYINFKDDLIECLIQMFVL